MHRKLAPSAAPLSVKDIFSSGLIAASRGRESEADFARILREYMHENSLFFTSSGKAAIYVVLRALRRNSQRRRVIIPAYSSYCLAAAIARSGLDARLCDIDPQTLDFDMEKLKRLVNEETLAVIAVHNYGLISRMEEICGIAAGAGAFVIEDAAQAAGGSYGTQMAGATGDFGVLSLGRGKGLCAMGGGVIICRSEPHSEPIGEEIAGLPPVSLSNDLFTMVKGLGLSLFLHPDRYALPASLPFLNIGANIFDPDFEVARISCLSAAIAVTTLENLGMFNDIRIKNARSFSSALEQNDVLIIPKPCTEGKSVYLRFPVLVKQKQLRPKIYENLEAEGLGASLSYPGPLGEIPGFRKCLICESEQMPGAKFISERILTLPTHPLVESGDIERITAILDNHGRVS